MGVPEKGVEKRVLPLGLPTPFRFRAGWGRPLILGGQLASLGLQVQMTISPGNTLTDTPINHILPAIWAAYGPIEST